jgi:CubicO group peptidase (beta-lactamase class C family)
MGRAAAGLCLLAAGACTSARPALRANLSPEEKARLEEFASDLESLRTSLGIPGLEAAVLRDGAVEWSRASGTAVRDAALPIGAITEAFTAVAALRLEARGKLRLDAPVLEVDPSFAGPRTVLVRHLLTHTSEETPGTTFHHESGEFARLTRILETASGKPFGALLEEEALRPAGLRETRAASGLSAATGLVSTVGDLARFEAALGGKDLVGPDALRRMTSPTFTPNGFLPHGIGWFVSWSAGERMVWTFGESTEASGLFFRLPDRGLALILLAKGPGLSAPFRLRYANPLRSPFALAFLQRFAPLVEEARRLVAAESLVDAALVLHWRQDPLAAAAFRKALAARGIFAPADGALLSALAERSEPDLLDAGETIGRQVQTAGWDNAQTLLDLAALNERAHRPQRARELLKGLLERENVRSAPLLAEARRLLAEAGQAP